MIGEVRIENYKSIQKLKLELGRVTVLIGENGCGKSNILEAIALASAAADNKLDNEFLASRGIRVTEPQLMRSAFEKYNSVRDIKLSLFGRNSQKISFVLHNENQPYSQWINKEAEKLFLLKFTNFFNTFKGDKKELIQKMLDDERIFINIFNETMSKVIDSVKLHNFLIYSPENYSLRIFEREDQIQPLGIYGEGLFKLLQVLTLEENQEKITEIKALLRLIDWFKDFDIPRTSSEFEYSLQIEDRYLAPDLNYFDQRSSNEGFLFLLFYFALFVSDKTPNFFAIDNIDASLNPRLCRRLIQELVELAQKHDKQVIFTTHNPAVLDGLDLHDDEQRLFVIYRNQLGHTKARRILKPEPLEGQEPVKLSEAFLRGYIGGLPKNF
jgi:AAA15 family ATPase/GTPase